jgi:hypothetical protein
LDFIEGFISCEKWEKRIPEQGIKNQHKALPFEQTQQQQTKLVNIRYINIQRLPNPLVQQEIY